MWGPQLTDAETRALPLLEIPVGEAVNFNLTSPDVIHAFWVPEFLFKRDVVPGHPNHFSITATQDRHVHRALQRVVRPLPQQDAVHAQDRDS